MVKQVVLEVKPCFKYQLYRKIFNTYDKISFLINIVFHFSLQNIFRTHVCLHVWSLLISSNFKQKWKAATKFSKTLKLHKTPCRLSPVATCETKHCCYHSYHDNDVALCTWLSKSRCRKGIYNAIAYVIHSAVDSIASSRRSKKLGCELIYDSDSVEYWC